MKLLFLLMSIMSFCVYLNFSDIKKHTSELREKTTIMNRAKALSRKISKEKNSYVNKWYFFNKNDDLFSNAKCLLSSYQLRNKKVSSIKLNCIGNSKYREKLKKKIIAKIERRGR